MWTSPLDASYRAFVHSNPVYAILASNVHQHEPMPSEASWLGIAAKRVARFFSDSSLRAR
ncbi:MULTISPECIES: hypothetical protein [unclassified Caballeronia]|uniref:hypothetical protein n=1 Tax=unclassified Caballeronia TaxID=2646786 RepID=UPI001FCF7BF8|nr:MULTISPECIES: hypothetical protein [unclassified Caballeronia]